MNKRRFFTNMFITLLTIIMITFNPLNYAQAKNNRIYGNDRIETSINISKEGWKNGSDVVVIAQGYNYAYALCSAPLAKKYNAPILLMGKDKLSDNTINELKRLNAKKVIH